MLFSSATKLLNSCLLPLILCFNGYPDNFLDLKIYPDFAFKGRKNLIRSKPASRSFYGMLILSVLQGCEMQVLNGSILKTIP
jgi:hypothetical protein